MGIRRSGFGSILASSTKNWRPRKVKVGRRMSGTVQILEGLKEGEQVATGATFFLDSESQLRASLQGYEAPQASTGAAAALTLVTSGSPAVTTLTSLTGVHPVPASVGHQLWLIVSPVDGVIV